MTAAISLNPEEPQLLMDTDCGGLDAELKCDK